MAEGWPGPGAALSQPCLCPRGLSPPWDSSSSSPSCLGLGAERLEPPQPLHPHPHPQVCASHRAEPQCRTEPGPGLAPRAGNPSGNAQGLVPALAGQRCPCALAVPWAMVASSTGTPAEPHPCALLPHLAQGSGGARGTSALPWHGEGTRNPPVSPPTGTSHIPRPPRLISPAQVSRTAPPHPQHGFGDQISSPHLLLSWRRPCPGLCRPQPPLGAWLASCGSRLPKPLPKAAQELSAPLAHSAPVYSWQLCQAGMTQSAPCAVGWMNNLCS